MTIQQLIDEALAKKEPRIRSGKYSPSSLGKCFRNQYWNRKDEPKSNPTDERTERVFKAGNLFHDFVQKTIKAHNQDAEVEVLVEDDDFKGFADLVLANEVIDLKSQHSRAFWYRNGKTWKEIEPMVYTNILQVMFYAINLGKERAKLVYISKDDLCIQEYDLTVTEDWLIEVKAETDKLLDIWAKQELPPAQPRAYPDKDGKPNECKYCSWWDKCKEIESAK